LAYKEIKKNGEFVLPGFGKLVKQKRKACTGFNPKTQQKIKIPTKTVVKFRVAKAAKGRGSRSKEVVSAWDGGYPRDLKAGFGMKSRKHAPHRDVDCSRTFF
jgi:Bacterial DNA-binding protein